MIIEQPSSTQAMNVYKKVAEKGNGHKGTELCGLFSLNGKITPLDDTTISNQLQQSRCPIKDALPLKIYKSPEETKDGLEDHVN